MTTMVFSGAGAAIGGAIGGPVGMQIGRAAGATIGYTLENASSLNYAMPSSISGGSEPIHRGQVERIRMNGVSEGNFIPRVYGRARMSGQVIWASAFREHVDAAAQTDIVRTPVTTGISAKGAPQVVTASSRSTTNLYTYSYTVSIAFALCEGEIAHIGRVWADGIAIDTSTLNMRVYEGTETQLPDSLIEAVEGAGNVPAYRGIAYVVIEDLELGQFGNRVPNLSFEVFKLSDGQAQSDLDEDFTPHIEGVALLPGSGEYALATSPIRYQYSETHFEIANMHAPGGATDIQVSLDELEKTAPGLKAAALIVSWFCNDLRVGECNLRPKVEQKNLSDASQPDSLIEGMPYPWRSGGITRSEAERVPYLNDAPVYGGTPSDASVIEAIKLLNQKGIKVLFYPFILMDQMEGNALPDPYSDAIGQPALPWRGRITTEKAPGISGTTDLTATATEEVSRFFGQASHSDFQLDRDTNIITYHGPEEWSFRRMILHQAMLCKAAGGVESFCIGTEMRGLTQIRGEDHRFPAVEALIDLAAEVRTILGSRTKIGYAADWSEYFGYTPTGENNTHYFHLDPLWASDNIDFIGIDNYMPLSDWREGDSHLDAECSRSQYDLDYLKNNIAGGEGYDWYYTNQEARDNQTRSPIEDGLGNQPWIYRYKDLRNWWTNRHFNRIDGEIQPSPTDWIPESKPFRFTEYGCAAIDKGANQPNVFIDPKSSESHMPYYSTGARDDLAQMQYLRATLGYWRDPENNPNGTNPLAISADENPYFGPMVDLSRSYVWAYDARPYPYFPSDIETWSDGDNYPRGHWINGRLSGRSLPSVVAEICREAGITEYDVSGLWGVVRGYSVNQLGSARSMIEPLAQAYGFDAIERDGLLTFRMRSGRVDAELDLAELALSEDTPHGHHFQRGAVREKSGRLRLAYTAAEASYEAETEEAVFGDERSHGVAASELPLMLTRTEGRGVLERWLAEARVGSETLSIAVPPSKSWLSPGDVIKIADADRSLKWRIDRAEDGETKQLEAVRIAESAYSPSELDVDRPSVERFIPPLPVAAHFLDLPIINEASTSYLPYIAMDGENWPGTAHLYGTNSDGEFILSEVIGAPSITGSLTEPLKSSCAAWKDDFSRLTITLNRGSLSSVSENALFEGANIAAIGGETPQDWELIQFQNAEPLSDNRWGLSGLIRGRHGTDSRIPESWPVGSRFVLMNGLPQQFSVTLASLGSSRLYRWGPGGILPDDLTYQEREQTFLGEGNRPYRPAHLKANKSGGDLEISWIRRTRIGGDSWEAAEVPLSESRESYRLRILDENNQERMTLSPETTSIRLSSEELAGVDLISGNTIQIQVAQFSPDFGLTGPYTKLEVTL